MHWVPDLDDAVRAYRDTGLPAHGNPAVDGFRNGAWRPDERYVEIATITAEQALPASRFADALALLRPRIDALDGSSGAIALAVEVADAAATAARLRGVGHKVREFGVTLEEHDVSLLEVFVLETPSWMPFFITYTPPR